MAEKFWLVPHDVDIGASASFGVRIVLPSASVLENPDEFAQECASLTQWEAGEAHPIPSIWTFMSKFGGCTSNGGIFWRLEEKQVVSLLMDGWFREAPSGSNYEYFRKKCVLVGSPGIGKSTLLCVVAFYLVFRLKKWVLIFRELAESDCLIYLGYDQSGAVEHFVVEDCTDVSATNIYRELVRQHGMSNVWLLLDNFEHHDVPEGLRDFDMLTAQQPVDLMFGERNDEFCCLLPSWSLKDLQLLGKLAYNFDENVVNRRYYYSGGSVSTFTLPTATDIEEFMGDAIHGVDDISLSLSTKWGDKEYNADPFCHVFVENVMEMNQFTCQQHWIQTIDVEHVLSTFSLQLGLDELYQIFCRAQSAGNGLLAKRTFELYVRRLAEDNKLYVSEFDPDSKERQNLHMTRLGLEKGKVVCSETSRYQVPAKHHVNELKRWRSNRRAAYMPFLACSGLPTVNAIVKLEPRPEKRSCVAYLRIAASPDFGESIDAEQQKTMNTVFSDFENADPPLYIFVCPDLAACKVLVANPPPEVNVAKTTCHLLVGYCSHDQ